tara:strand:+ start:623 stop:802 length:180 start_codon:yes stop_codon:yes gene_type:complete
MISLEKKIKSALIKDLGLDIKYYKGFGRTDTRILVSITGCLVIFDHDLTRHRVIVLNKN